MVYENDRYQASIDVIGFLINASRKPPFARKTAILIG
mgnify:CR=1 FL=1